MSPALSASHDRVSEFLAFHFSWDFLEPVDRASLAQAYRAMHAYAVLRRSSVHRSVAYLRHPRPPPTGQGLDPTRAWDMGIALLRFNFVYGDLVRWLGGEYTGAQRNWQQVFADVEHIRASPPMPGYPPVDIDRAYHACTEGVPLAGHFECQLESVLERNRYDNHPGLEQHMAEVHQKFSNEEENSFHLALPRFLVRFVFGLFICPLLWMVRKGKGRICVDGTNTINDHDDGAPNARIPRPGMEGAEDECPPVYYATALSRQLKHIWNLRIQHPYEDILQHVDDIHAAFHRILYHPDIAIVFAYVFQRFLMIPVGMIFGSRNSPSWFCLFSELRAHMSAVGYNDAGYCPREQMTDLAQ